MKHNLGKTYAREYALQALYSNEFHDSETPFSMPDLERMEEIDMTYATLLVEGVNVHKAELDTLISAKAKKWSLHRINKVDAAILRIALFEMKFMEPPVDARVAINEAILLAKAFSGEDSYKFINGLLDGYVEK